MITAPAVAPSATAAAPAPGPGITTPRSANPGIVPPWLQHAPGEAPAEARNPGIVPPWLQQAPADAADAPSELRAAAGGGVGDIDGFVPRSRMPRGPVRTAPDAARLGAALQREQQRAQVLVDDVRGFFSELGVTAAEGNDDRVVVEFLPDYDNAAYVPDADHIHIGVDPRTGRSFADGNDVVAHEYAHRIVDRLSQGLALGGEDAAIHESLADTFAAAYDPDWTLGEDLGEPIRRMDRPELLGHPGHVDDLARVFGPGSKFMHPATTTTGETVQVPDVHVVAGVPNKAAAIIGAELGRPTMAKIYINALRDHVRPGRRMEGLAAATMLAARELYGVDSREFGVTQQAWQAVGVLDLLKEQAAAVAARG